MNSLIYDQLFLEILMINRNRSNKAKRWNESDIYPFI